VDSTEFFTVDMDESEIGVMVFMSPSAEIAFLHLGSDLIIDEVRALAEEIVRDEMRSDAFVAEVFQGILTRTVDPSPTGQTMFPWAEIPCPNCGAYRRKQMKPTNQGIRVPDIPVTHERWASLRRHQKLAIAAEVVDEIEARATEDTRVGVLV
jgi:hypothetical protein